MNEGFLDRLASTFVPGHRSRRRVEENLAQAQAESSAALERREKLTDEAVRAAKATRAVVASAALLTQLENLQRLLRDPEHRS